MQTDLHGLTTDEAAAWLAADGPNELPRRRRRQLPRILRDVLTEPMFALLLGSGVIYLVLGDTLEALLLLIFASLSVGIAVIRAPVWVTAVTIGLLAFVLLAPVGRALFRFGPLHAD